MRKAKYYWTDIWVCVTLQCPSIRRQSSGHAAGTFAVSCNSQAKVAAWLQSSDDMDKCSKGETTESRPVPPDMRSSGTLMVSSIQRSIHHCLSEIWWAAVIKHLVGLADVISVFVQT